MKRAFIQYTIGANNLTLLDCLFDLLRADRGDVIEIGREDDGSIYLKKKDRNREEALEAFKYVAKRMTEEHVLENAGLKTEQDVADFINELREAKSHS